ncbi:hypothetical protein PFISCL1PPCAC_2952, partial [Pristionchus fissidentatus]
MNEMESLEDGSATTNTNHFNFQIQSSIFGTPPSILAPPNTYLSNMFKSPLLAPPRLSCLLCRTETFGLGAVNDCKHKILWKCSAPISELGCPSCIEESPTVHGLKQLRMSPSHL